MVTPCACGGYGGDAIVSPSCKQAGTHAQHFALAFMHMYVVSLSMLMCSSISQILFLVLWQMHANGSISTLSFLVAFLCILVNVHNTTTRMYTIYKFYIDTPGSDSSGSGGGEHT